MTGNQTIKDTITKKQDKFQKAALEIHAHPEVSDFEFFAQKTLTSLLEEEGFEIEHGAAGHRTGFAAAYRSEKPGPTIAFLAEYDALEGIGHGCGHNLFGAASSLGAVALKPLLEEIGGEIRVYGTPGEEGGQNGSAKGSFVREGYFKDVDAALCVHPGAGPDNHLSSRNLACAPVKIEFRGRSAHAAGCPEKGINALDAQIQVYNSISVLRQQLPAGVRIHGIIENGGLAPNVIPDFTRSRYYLRAEDRYTLQEVMDKVEKIVEGAALCTGCTGSIELYQNLVENMVITPSLDELFARNLRALGQSVEPQSKAIAPGSSDVGNVSQVVPTIQPSISVSDERIAGHSIEMVQACASEKGLRFVPLAAQALALTARDLITNPDLLEKIKADHREQLIRQKEERL